MNTSRKPILTLKQFILKQEVKTLYRRILRAIKQVEDINQRNELKEWAQRDFRSNAHLQEEMAIKMSIKHGERCLKQLETSINLAKS